VQLRQRHLLDGRGHLVARCSESLGGGAQHAGPRVFGAVHPVPEAHQLLATVQDSLDQATCVTRPFDLFEHRQHPGRCTAVQGTAHRAHRPGQRRGHIRAG